MLYFNINTINYKTTVKYAARASTVDILLKTNLAVRPLPELEICLLYTSALLTMPPRAAAPLAPLAPPLR